MTVSFNSTYDFSVLSMNAYCKLPARCSAILVTFAIINRSHYLSVGYRVCTVTSSNWSAIILNSRCLQYCILPFCFDYRWLQSLPAIVQLFVVTATIFSCSYYLSILLMDVFCHFQPLFS